MSRRLRCAIYTRKSTEEGLDMAFNSLDAQREACEAYIASQKSEGWHLLPEAYDDGGFSGGSMERSGLQRLLADVEAGRVDVIVVYKVDRLTRSLADFAKVVDILDDRGASFVSITQSFNTTTSMGRLTLNVLLSFAQFEREVIAERVRDKVAQSKARGIWMGGMVPLGYDVVDRKLLINEADAQTVRTIFTQYLALGSVRELKSGLGQQGIVTKRRQYRNSHRGGTSFSRGGLYHMLSNPIYIGKLRHKALVHDGEHQAIIDLPMWQAVQAKLNEQASDKRIHGNGGRVSLLSGMIRDSEGRPMSPSHSCKNGRRYRYYVSNGEADEKNQVMPTMRLSAPKLEQAVKAALRSWLCGEGGLTLGMADHMVEATIVKQRMKSRDGLIETLASGSVGAQRALLQSLGCRIVIHADRIDANMSQQAVISVLNAETDPLAKLDDQGISIPLTIPTMVVRQGAALKLVLKAPRGFDRKPDAGLVDLIVKAEQAKRTLFLANEKKADPHLVRQARLAFLAPDIVAAILQGRQPAHLNSKTLLRVPSLPLEWGEQRRALGFG